MTNDMQQKNDYEMGQQPLEAILQEMGLSNTDLVKASEDGLTHKMVRKGRRGRRLTRNVQMKILNALNKLSGEERQFKLRDLFNYR